MAVPKKRTTKSKRNMRRSHHQMQRLQLASCPRCSNPVRPHTTCPNCGTYQGREIIDVLKKLDKKERKAKEKELAKEQQDKQEQQQGA